MKVEFIEPQFRADSTFPHALSANSLNFDWCDQNGSSSFDYKSDSLNDNSYWNQNVIANSVNSVTASTAKLKNCYENKPYASSKCGMRTESSRLSVTCETSASLKMNHSPEQSELILGDLSPSSPTTSNHSSSSNSLSNENSSPSDQNQRGSHNKLDKLCGVCGDKALGHNFNAITCESCKAFFRRNALKPKDFVCPFKGDCEVNAITRRFCQKCRLKKCFAIGMKKEWIMTEEEKRMKKKKIEQNRKKRVSSDTASVDVCTPKQSNLKTSEIDASHASEDNHDGRQRETNSDPSSSVGTVSGFSNQPLLTALNEQNSLPHRIPYHVNVNPPPEQRAENHDGTMPIFWEDQRNQKPSYYDNHLPVQKYGVSQEKSAGQLENERLAYLNSHVDNVLASRSEAPGHSSTSEKAASNQTPLLSSLMRTGAAESPPDSGRAINGPPSTEDYVVVGEKRNQVIPRPSYHSVEQEQSYTAEGFANDSYNNSNSASSCPKTEGTGCPKEVVQDYNSPLLENTMESIMSVAITAEYSACARLGISQSTSLNKAEHDKLQELLIASQALHTPVDEEAPRIPETSDPSLINVINLTDVAIRRLIRMSKKISAFKNMCQDDQIALLKGGCTEMMILRSVVSYDPDRDSWAIPHTNVGYNIKLGVLKEARGNLYEEHRRFVKSFKPEWRTDERIMVILCAITLFTAERPNVIHKDVIKLEKDSYFYLLRRYLESIMDGCEARSTYLQLIKRIAELHSLNSNHLRVFLEVNPREVEPLLIEIFDLKQ